MKLILGVGVVGRSAIEFFKNEKLCFYDEVFNEYTDRSGDSVHFFSSWEEIDQVIVSPGFPIDHFMILEAQKRNIQIETDVSIFLKNTDMIGTKIGITGTNGKSTLCALLKYIFADLAEIGGNFGISPLSFKKNTFYILELSSYQLYWLNDDLLKTLDIGVIVNLGNHHLSYHKTKAEYVRVKKKILNSKNTICDVKISDKIRYPKNEIFEKDQYKLAWNIILKILQSFNFDEKIAAQRLESYVPLRYRQSIINENPLIINDSKATNVSSMSCALANMRRKFILISQVTDYNQEDFDIYQYSLLQKIFILSTKEVEGLKLPFFVSNNFETVVEEALKYARENDYAVLFSPGEQSFEFFKNFETRGEFFSDLVKKNGYKG